MRAVRWILLLLYLTLVGRLVATAISEDARCCWYFWPFIAALLCVLRAGHEAPFHRIGWSRTLHSIVSVSFMLAASCLLWALLFGLMAALCELFQAVTPAEEGMFIRFWLYLLATWVFCAIILFVYNRKSSRYRAIFQVVPLVFAASTAELLVSASAHIFVIERGDRYAGSGTSLGVAIGLFAIVWSLGPLIFLLFLRGTHGGKARGEAARPLARRAVRAPFQFHVRTLLLAMLLVGSVCALLRPFVGRWPLAYFAAWGVLLSATPLLLTRPWLLSAALAVAVAGLLYASWPWGVRDWRGDFPDVAACAGLMGVVLAQLVMGDPILRRTVRPGPDL